MKKSFILKGLSALIILSSVGVAESAVNATHNVAHAEKNVKEIKNGNIAPYSSAVSFVSASGFSVGSNTVVTNKHVAKKLKIGDRVFAHPTGDSANGGVYSVTSKVEYPGIEDVAVVHVGKSEGGWNFDDHTTALPLASKAYVGERISVIGYPKPSFYGYKLFESTGKVVEIRSWQVTYDAYAEPGNSGSAIVNEKGEAIGIHYAGDREGTPDQKSYGIYFTKDIKDFIYKHMKN
ncbi:hypothetical protein B4W72_02230 [Staphylococcus delphini]|uniref:Serine protease n=1 Tax=Staphylococcus delphini TaxID=53344 RepID=A0A2A4GZZ6_9STAP|nr:serine protease [Staphylococcus delphini]PCF57144.1 hypothetical protein B5C08_00005 [Staphylococcus delphini]PCF62526.1 hypothetical protein B5C01_03175 [Staphylococcus delphini]PCF75650.1 hypothetical protein B4W72_02230 [Staphylococcus delphini]HEC2157121.1 serine protease [Staphylococcus delphini]